MDRTAESGTTSANFPEEIPREDRRRPTTTSGSTRTQNIPVEKIPEGITNTRALNLDCGSDQEQNIRIQKWYNEMKVLVYANEYLSRVTNDPKAIREAIMVTLTGNVARWAKYLIFPKDLDRSGIEYLEAFVQALYQEFLGKDHNAFLEETNSVEQQEAIFRLDNMRLCNLCELEEFICEYLKNYYKVSDRTLQPRYKDLIFDKMPHGFGIDLKASFPTSTYPQTIGGAIRAIRGKLLRTCKEITEKKKVRKAIKKGYCCEKQEFTIKDFGCKKQKEKRRESSKNHYYRKPYNKYRNKKYRSFKKYSTERYKKDFNNSYRKPQFRNKFFRRKPEWKKKPPCPKGKGKDCKCWLCNEQGHYANECPVRATRHDNQNWKNRVKYLEDLRMLDIYPIEDNIIEDK
ncbi:MAG: hypothetical protein EOP45_19130, partial [Sphingobacteriaceae bacterium]